MASKAMQSGSMGFAAFLSALAASVAKATESPAIRTHITQRRMNRPRPLIVSPLTFTVTEGHKA
jgi:hypothetical protein